MTHRQAHRGPAPQDARLFGPRRIPDLRAAAHDLCWLLDREYAARSALELVGNRYSLTARQRMALSRFACSAEEARNRGKRKVELAHLADQELWIDGFNVLTLLETAAGGGLVLRARDGCCRDIAGIHRRHRRVDETIPAVRLVGDAAQRWGIGCCRFWLDEPISNSARLKQLILEVARESGWNMTVDLAFNPDHVLAETAHAIATSDGAVLDRCRRWVDLVGWIVAEHLPAAWVVDFGTAPPG